MNGFTKIENKLFEKILTSNFTKRQLKILLLIVRFSFGCQKNYAILKNQDFTYAQVSPYCIKVELMKLIEKKIIEWDSEKGMVLINKNLNEWAVDNSGNNPVDNSYRFIKIANKNLPKQQHRGCQNSNILFNKTATSISRKTYSDKENQLPKENKETLKKKKEKEFLKILNNYFLKITPLIDDEKLILKELSEVYRPETFEKAISIVSQGNDHSFSYFQKVLADIQREEKTLTINGFERLKSSLERFSIPKL